MQSAHAVRVRCIRVCSILQQKNGKVFSATGGRHYQSRSVLRRCLVYIRSRCQQNPPRSHIALLAGKQ